MKKLGVKMLVLVAVLTAGVLAILYATREPSADGRTLSEWLRIAMESADRGDRAAATNAVRKIGVEGIPVLLDKLRARDSVWKMQLKKRLRFGVFPDRNAAGHRHFEAVIGFSILGPQAVSAIPELSKMLFATNGFNRSGEVLGLIGPASLPVLREALTNHDGGIRERAAAGIAARRDVAILAMPEILALREGTDKLTPHIVLNSLSDTLPEHELWPVAAAYLQASRLDVQHRALGVIRFHVRTNSKSAVPLVVPFLTNLNSSLRETATNTLIALDPVAAATHGVNTNKVRRTFSGPVGRGPAN